MRVAGIGLRQGASLDSLRAVLAQAEDQAGPVARLAAPADKADHPALRALATARGLPLCGVAVAGVATPSQSPRVQARYGTGSVAEAAALAAAGPGGVIRLARIVAPDDTATCAIAEQRKDNG